MSTTKVNKEELISLGSELSTKSKDLSSLVSSLKGSLSKIDNYDDIDITTAVSTLSKNLDEISTDVNNVSLNISNYASKVSDFDTADFDTTGSNTTSTDNTNSNNFYPTYSSNNTNSNFREELGTEASTLLITETTTSPTTEANVVSKFTPLVLLDSVMNPEPLKLSDNVVETPIVNIPIENATEPSSLEAPIIEERPYTYKIVSDGKSFVFKKVYLDTGADVTDSNVSSPNVGDVNNSSDNVFTIDDIFNSSNNVQSESSTNGTDSSNGQSNELEEDGTLVSGDTEIDLSKYNNKIEKGFEVTQGNLAYSLDEADVDLLCAIVAAESDKTYDDALAVITTILNRCEASNWVRVYGTDPLDQATAPNQFVVYQEGYYERYINGNAPEKVKIAVQDALAGVRNHNYLSFRSGGTTSYSDNRITDTGNRYK